MPEDVRTPTISIYQNPDHVAGILQQVYGQPLVEAEQREQTSESSKSKRRGRGATGSAKIRGSLPTIGAACRCRSKTEHYCRSKSEQLVSGF